MNLQTPQIETAGLRAHAQRVVAVTSLAWAIAPRSPRAAARVAPHGYVPVRAQRRQRAAAACAAPSLLHSW